MLYQKMAGNRFAEHPLGAGKQMCPYPNGVRSNGMGVGIIGANVDMIGVAHFFLGWRTN